MLPLLSPLTSRCPLQLLFLRHRQREYPGTKPTPTWLLPPQSRRWHLRPLLPRLLLFSPPDFIEVTMGDVDVQVALMINKQTEKWDAMDQEQDVWNAIEEQQKLERRKKKQR